MTFEDVVRPARTGRAKTGPKIETGAWLRPLSAAVKGQKMQIKRLRGKEETRRFLQNLGFVEDAEVTVITELNGNVIVHIKGARIAVSKTIANLVWTVENIERR